MYYDKTTSEICHKTYDYEGEQHARLCQNPFSPIFDSCYEFTLLENAGKAKIFSCF